MPNSTKVATLSTKQHVVVEYFLIFLRVASQSNKKIYIHSLIHAISHSYKSVVSRQTVLLKCVNNNNQQQISIESFL